MRAGRSTADRFLKELALQRLLSRVPHLTVVAAPLASDRQRYIVVGDVHGCLAELNELLRKVEYDPVERGDQLILLGDLVGKGPDSIGVLERAMELQNCLVTLGNHDWTLLRWYEAVCEQGVDSVLFSPSAAEGNPYPAMAQQLRPSHVAFLRQCPHAIVLPEVDVLCVHAGVNPFAKGSPESVVAATSLFDLLHMRNVVRLTDSLAGAYQAASKLAAAAVGNDPSSDMETNDDPGIHVPTAYISESVDGEPWAAHWRGPYHVVFGHDAMRKLQRHAFATGIDTGCCYGGALTALIIDRHWDPASPTLVSVESSVSCLDR